MLFRHVGATTLLALLISGCVEESSTTTSSGPGTAPAKPQVTLESSADPIEFGAVATLTWSAKDATGCTASGAWSGTKPTSGSESTGALTADADFTLQCSSAGGSATAAKKVRVNPPKSPTVQLTATPTSVAFGASSTLSWSSANSNECVASGAWSGTKAASGSETTGALSANVTYTLTCSGAGGVASASASVIVAPPPTPNPAPVITLAANPDSVAYNGSTTLTWSASNATSCTASGNWSGAKSTSGTEPRANLTVNVSYTLSCTGSGGTASQTVSVMVAPPAPTVTLDASPTAVAYNGSTTLTWSSTHATSCTASGSWSGTKATGGTQSFSNLTANRTYTLTCTGAGGSANHSANVTVAPPPAPTLTFSANPSSVAYNGTTTLSWSTGNATACTASNGWSGTMPTNGTQVINNLTVTTTYTLECSGPGGTVSQSVPVTVTSGTSGTITGTVDSSRINRKGSNKMYLFSGTVTPDDYDGSGDPVASVDVVQDENACTFSYSFTGVVPGTYTIAFTNQAATDVAGQDNALTFVGTGNITVGSTAVAHNVGAARVLRVGPGKTYSKPSLAGAAAQAGDVIEIDAGEYVDDHMVWRDNDITIRGVGGRAHMRGTVVRPFISGDDVNNGMGLWVIKSNNVVVENIEFSGAMVEDLNGAGIRANGNGLIVCNSHFHDNQDGILGGAGEVLIEYSEFNNNGFGDPGYNHNLYIDSATTKFVFRHNYTHDAIIGHELKSRAVENHILYNRIMNRSGTGSYEIDIPNGGLTYVIGNVVQQGPNTDNSTIVSYGAEGLATGRTHKLYVVNNTFVNDLGSGRFIYANGSTAEVQLINNILVGGGTDVSGPPSGVITRTTNLVSNSPGLANRAAYDYRLTSAATAAINMGSNPGSVNGFDLRPLYHYVDPGRRAPRVPNGAYDIGAYEYTP